MKRKILGLIILTSLLLVTGCFGNPKLSNGKDLIAKIDGKEITINEVYNELKKQYGTNTVVNIIDNFIANKELKTDDSAKESANFKLEQIKASFENSGQDFNEALHNNGYQDEKEFVNDLILEYKRNKLVENYYKDSLTNEEIEEYYNNNVYGDMNVRHILIIPEEKDNDEKQTKSNNKALKQAKDLIEKLNNGEDFVKLAKEYSQDTANAEDGGLINNVRKDEYVDEFFEAALTLKKGAYTKEPIETMFGYHIILKLEQKEKPTLEEARDNITNNLIREKLEVNTDEASQKAWVEIRKKYNLEIFDKEIKRIYNLNTKFLKDE